MNNIIRIFIIAALLFNCLVPGAAYTNRYTKVLGAGITFWHRSAPNDPILTEAAHIYFCQVVDYGCINNVVPNDGATWVKPREMGTAILGLIEAYFAAGSGAESNDLVLYGIQTAASYLYFRQEADGAWCKHYDEANGLRSDLNKSPSETGSVIMALFRIHEVGLEAEAPGPETYYDKAKMGAEFIIACIDNKPGTANGLAGAGKEYYHSGGGSDDFGDGNGPIEYRWSDWSWISDNCYAYHALKCMKVWATEQGDATFAATCESYANGIYNGINNMKNPSNTTIWRRVVDGNGNSVPTGESTLVDALCYYPVKMNVSSNTVFSSDIAQWMTDNLQKNDGGVSQGMGAFKWKDADPDDSTRSETSDRLSPGFSMEAWLALNNISGEVAIDSQNRAKMWWEAQEGCDGNGQLWDYQEPFQWTNQNKGGFVDWFDPDGMPGNKFRADITEKFIDTSAYAIMVYNGGFNYDFASQAGSPLIAHSGESGALASETVFITSGTITAGSSKDKNDTATLLAFNAPRAASSYAQRQKLDGLKQVNMYYYADGEPIISTASVRIPGQAATYNFRFEVPVKLAQHKYLYYCLEVVDSRGFHTFWPSAHRKQFYRVEVKSLVTGQIGMGGGTVELVSGGVEGNTSVEIPAGAFDKNETVKIDEIVVDNSIQSGGSLTGNAKPLAVYEFTLTPPKAGTFNKAVTMRLHYNTASLGSANEDSLRVFWWDGVEWRMIGGEVDKTKHLVSTRVMHFSRYGVFPTRALTDNDYRPKERIITPAYSDGNYDFAQFGGVDNIDVINIYDVNGKRIRQLHNALVWDGTDDSSNVVESGLYIYQIKLRDSGKIISGTIAIAK